MQTISSLEKDIAGLKKEIGERDETIGDKEKRIYDLKKKNQASYCCTLLYVLGCMHECGPLVPGAPVPGPSVPHSGSLVSCSDKRMSAQASSDF